MKDLKSDMAIHPLLISSINSTNSAFALERFDTISLCDDVVGSEGG